MKKLIYILFLIPVLVTGQPSDMFWAAGSSDITESVLFNKVKIDSFDVSPYDGLAYGLYILPGGYRFFTASGSGNGIDEYITSTADSIAGLVHQRFISTSAQTVNPQDIWFSTDSSKLYILDYTGGSVDAIYQYSMTTAGDLTTLNYDNKNFTVGSYESVPTGFSFKSDGTKFLLVGSEKDSLFQFSLTTAWDIETASFDNKRYDLSIKGTNPNDVYVLSDGESFLVGDPSTVMVSEYINTTTWSDVSNSEYLYMLDVGGSSYNISGVFMNDNETKLFISDPLKDMIYGFE